MITNLTPVSTLFARSMAVNTPLFMGAGVLAGGLCSAAWYLHKDTDRVARNRAFMRAIAKRDDTTDAMLLYFHRCADAVETALTMIQNPETNGSLRLALRDAVAVSI